MFIPCVFHIWGAVCFLKNITYYEDNILLKIVFIFNFSHKPLALQLSIEIDLLFIGKYKFEKNYMHTYYGK